MDRELPALEGQRDLFDSSKRVQVGNVYTVRLVVQTEHDIAFLGYLNEFHIEYVALVLDGSTWDIQVQIFNAPQLDLTLVVT